MLRRLTICAGFMPLAVFAMAFLGRSQRVRATPSAEMATSVEGPSAQTMADILAHAPASAWRRLADANTLYLRLPRGLVVIELAPNFAPAHFENIKKLVAAGYFDQLVVMRVQDNYVAQWGDPNADTDNARPWPEGANRKLPAEFDRPALGVEFTRHHTVDPYASRVGWVNGFPAAGDRGRVWLVHCYGMVGVSRGEAPNSGNGAELYAVIGHSPRHLDRNITVVGRVIIGMEHLAALPRGTGPLGFYEHADQGVPIATVRLASQLPEADRLKIEVMRTSSAAFAALIRVRRFRRERWFLKSVGHIDLCNVPIPSRVVPAFD